MGVYRHSQKSPQSDPRPYKVHPLWRGVGCLMIVLVPLVAYAGASLMMQNGVVEQMGVPLPAELTQDVPLSIEPIVISGRVLFPGYSTVVVDLYANLVIGLVLTFLGFGILMVFYSIIFGMMGPKRFGPLDAPPEYRHPKQSKNKKTTFRR